MWTASAAVPEGRLKSRPWHSGSPPPRAVAVGPAQPNGTNLGRERERAAWEKASLDVPSGRLKIAQRFIAGWAGAPTFVPLSFFFAPSGRLKIAQRFIAGAAGAPTFVPLSFFFVPSGRLKIAQRFIAG